MKNIIPGFLFVIILATDANGQRFHEIPEAAQYFRNYGVDGTFIVRDLKNDSTICFNPARARERFIPASTFKIANTLIALETGVVTDEKFVIPWDSTRYDVESWNQDQTLRSAFKYSAVWYYQEVARRIGPARMRHFIDTLDYGNRDISGGIDLFWLSGGLRISCEEQVEFLKRLYTYRLPLSRRSIDILKKIMVLEKTDRYVFSAKTGLALRGEKLVGWLVGFLERDDDVWFFATNIGQNDRSDTFGAARLDITRSIFRSLKLME